MKRFDFKSINKKFWSFLENNYMYVFFIILIFLSFLIRLCLIKYPSGEYDMFLKPWFDNLKENGGLLGLSKDISNYNAPYITILALLTYLPIDSLISIKLVSILFDYVSAFAVMLIVKELFKGKKYEKKISFISFFTILFLPTIFLNSAYWAQSDSVYTAFGLLSILYLIRKKYLKSFIYLGMAFAFKLQTIFILPLYILIFITNREITLKHFLLVPLTNIIMCLPAICFGYSIEKCIMVYVNQTGTYNQYLTLNLPNFYGIFFKGLDVNNPNLINSTFSELSTIGIIFTMMIFVTIAFLVFHKKVKFDNTAIIEFGLLSILIACFFLPQMHERYLYMADILGIVYLCIDKKRFYIPLSIILISLNGYMYLLFGGFALSFNLLSILYLIILVIYSNNIYQKYFKE